MVCIQLPPELPPYGCPWLEILRVRARAVILDDHQPNMSDLVNGKIAKFSIDKLVRYADRLGIETTVKMVEHKERQLEYA